MKKISKIRAIQIVLGVCTILLIWLGLATKYHLIRDVEGTGLIMGETVIPIFAISIIWYISVCSRRKSELSKFDRLIFYLCWICLIGIPAILMFGLF